MSQQLTSQQNKYLRSLAHGLKPLVLVGKNGLTAEVIAAVDAALEKHELIKVKFIEHKEKSRKMNWSIASATSPDASGPE